MPGQGLWVIYKSYCPSHLGFALRASRWSTKITKACPDPSSFTPNYAQGPVRNPRSAWQTWLAERSSALCCGQLGTATNLQPGSPGQPPVGLHERRIRGEGWVSGPGRRNLTGKGGGRQCPGKGAGLIVVVCLGDSSPF